MSHSANPEPLRARLDAGAGDLDQLVDRFEIHEEIGRGATSRVHRATQLGVQREVALKLIRIPDQDEDDQRGRMLREARLIAGIHHPGLAQIYDCGIVGSTAFLSIEYLRGATLDERLRDGAIPVPEALRLARQLASVLSAVHEHGYIHRDLKPANIFLVPGDTGAEQIKVIDFGVARRIGLSASETARLKQTLRGLGEKHTVQTLTGIVFGTPAYMSPEQAMGLALGARSDLYSLGCVMYEMLTGTAPFDTRDIPKALWGHIAVPPTPPRQVNPEARIPEEVEAIVLKLMAKQPSERFRDARALITALDVAAGDLPRSALLDVDTRRPHGGQSSEWPKLVAFALLVAAACVGLVLWLADPGGQTAVARPAASVPHPQMRVPGPLVTPAPDDTSSETPTPSAARTASSAEPQHTTQHSVPPGNTKKGPPPKPSATTPNPQPTPDPNYELPELRGVK
ncbi:MAG: protein kinase [Myxococcales bacterium]|nr:protein kinase [Myxococcales bacterium]